MGARDTTVVAGEAPVGCGQSDAGGENPLDLLMPDRDLVMSRSAMPWLFVASLLAAGIIFLVTGLRSDQADEFNINLLAAGVDFAVTSLVTAFVVERFRTLREARDQARLYEVVTDRLTTAAQEWVAALPGTAGRPASRTTAGASNDDPRPDLTGALKVAATALEPARFDGLGPDTRVAVADHSVQLLRRFVDCLELLYAAAPSPALLAAVADLRLAQDRWSAGQFPDGTVGDLAANTQATLQAARAAETALGGAPSTAGFFQRARTPVQLAVGGLLLPLPAAVGGVVWMLQTALGLVRAPQPAVDAVPGLVSMVLGVLAVSAVHGGHWLGGVALAVGCAAAAEPYTLLTGVWAAAAKVTPDVLAGLVVIVATVVVVAGWQVAAALIATAVLAVTTLLVAWFRFLDRVERLGRSAAGVEVGPRRLTGVGWLVAILGWVGASALLVAGSRLLTGAVGPVRSTSPWVVVISLWCGYWVSLRWRDGLARQPRLSRPIPHR
jgi:hypothetical protein